MPQRRIVIPASPHRSARGSNRSSCPIRSSQWQTPHKQRPSFAYRQAADREKRRRPHLSRGLVQRLQPDPSHSVADVILARDGQVLRRRRRRRRRSRRTARGTRRRSGAGLVVSSLLGPCPSTPAFRGGRGRAAGQTGANGPKATSASPPADNLWPRVPLRAGVARDAEGRGSGSASALRPNSFFSHNACPQALRSCGQSRLSAKERKSICLGPLTIGWGHVRLPALSRAQASPLQHLQQVGLVLGGPGPPSVQGRDPAAVLVEDDGGGLVDAALAADRLAIVDVHRCEVDLLAARSLAQLREIVARRPAGDGRRGVWPPAVEVHEHVPRP
ncbi:unnamed protein product [Prorocentrum cordatum]|uniref:Uncharacterized protein n=1 Tax=Prorocentrum cordatum TaxID=2364126 RepID=A0ABN9X0I5_9DINO|nr:unnamed protein product [Polarella glacialis]